MATVIVPVAALDAPGAVVESVAVTVAVSDVLAGAPVVMEITPVEESIATQLRAAVTVSSV